MADKRSKLVLVLFLVSAVVVLTLSLFTGFSLNTLVDSLEQSRNERLLAEAQSASLIVSASELEAINSNASLQSEKSVALQRRLNAFADLHNLTSIAYLRQLPSGQLQYLISNNVGAEEYNISTAPIEASEAAQRAWGGSLVVTPFDEVTQQTGSFMAYSPVFNAEGKVVAVAAVGVDDGVILDADSNIRNLTIILLLCIALVILAACANVLLQVRKEHELEEGMRVQKLMVVLSQKLASEQPFNNRVTDVLQTLGSYLNASRAYIVCDVNEDAASAIRHYWASVDEGASLNTRATSAMLETLRDALSQQHGARETTLFCSNVDQTQDSRYEKLRAAHIAAFIWAPLSVQGEIWGTLVLDFAKEQPHESDNDTQLIESAASDLVGAITRELYNEQREQALDHAIHAGEAKGEFLSNMSHEMRTPMNAIIGMTSIALSSISLERKDYCLEHIREASDRLLAIINDVLDMSSIEANTILLAHRPFDVREALADAISAYLPRMHGRNQHFSSEIDERVPTLLMGDKQRLMQVISNLLSNAVKFTPAEGTIALKVKQAGVGPEGHFLRFEVQDSGIGVNPAIRDTLFNSFSQAESGSNRKYGGTGLGLAISRRLVELMGGQIGMESDVNKGSRFFFTVVLAEGRYSEHGSEHKEATSTVVTDDAEDTSSPASAGADWPDDFVLEEVQTTAVPGSRAPNLSGYRILLAEDIDINREVVLALLEESGVTVDIATNGREAFEAVKDNPDAYDLVFMDLQMPEMDGMDATRRIRALVHPSAATLPIIAMTANVMQKDIDACLSAGMNDHIGKPISLMDVYRTLAMYLPEN